MKNQLVGWILILIVAALLGAVLMLWRTRPMVVYSVVAAACVGLQPVFALSARGVFPELAAIHAANALAIFWCASKIMSLAWRPES